MNLAQLDFQQLRIKHILYKSKVRSVLYGGVYDETFFSRAGPIHQWFSTVGSVRYSHEPELHELVTVHQELNNTAHQLFSLYKGGKIDQAHEGMKSVEMTSDRFLQLLARMENRLKDDA